MFCPRCGAQNKTEQKFCRQCGQALPMVRLALEGRAEEAAELLQKGLDNLGGGWWTMSFFIAAALVNFFLWDWGVLINLVLGLLITVRWTLRGFKELERGIKLLDPKAQPERAPTLPNEPPFAAALPSVPDTDPLRVQTPVSVIEDSTLPLPRDAA